MTTFTLKVKSFLKWHVILNSCDVLEAETPFGCYYILAHNNQYFWKFGGTPTAPVYTTKGNDSLNEVYRETQEDYQKRVDALISQSESIFLKKEN
jgi:hypothetical protein